MKIFSPVRLMLLALLFALVPASSFAGVFISVGFAPPILPVYEQPPCPEPGLMWTPGYWAYGEDDYYWVPGTWVPAPFEGALWTPPYWGWEGGLFLFHPGYWSRHVGYYGGVNYGFGYMGIGFVGGMWRGHDFIYNTAVMSVDRRFVHTTYEDRGIVERNTIFNERHVAFSGGPGGIRHDPMPEERFAEHEQHQEATSFQHSHESSAMSDRGSYMKNNGGRPSNPAVSRPMSGGNQGAPGFDRSKSAHDDWSAPTRMQENQGGGNQGRPNYNNNPPNPGNVDTRNNNNYNGNGTNNNNGSNNNPHPNNANPATREFNNSHSNTGNTPPHPAPEFRQPPQPPPPPPPKPAPQAQPQAQQHDHGGKPHDDSKDHQH